MPNPNPEHISAQAYEDLVRGAQRDAVTAGRSLTRREAEEMIDPGLAPFPATPPAGMLTRAVAKMQNVWKGGKR